MPFRRWIFASASFATLLFLPRRAECQPREPARDWSMGAGLGVGTPGLNGAPFWSGSLSVERRFTEHLAIIAAAGGSFDRVSTKADTTDRILVSVGPGLRAFLGERGDVEPSVFCMVRGEYANFGDKIGGVIAELGASVDAKVSPSVGFRIGASLAHAGFFSFEHGSDTTLLGVGLGPQAELRANW